jgi:GDP-mannose 6-dehydrogenase
VQHNRAECVTNPQGIESIMQTISVFGLGYVGAVTAACLADAGHRVLGVDVSAAKVEMLESGRSPVLEPGLDDLIAASRKAGRLHATRDAVAAVSESEISFICVGTPSLPNGRLDLGSLERVCEEIGKALRSKKEFHWIVVRSTVLPGTARSVVIPRIELFSQKRAGIDFAVCGNPEFTREGCAVADFLNPALTVLGADDPAHLLPIRKIYEGLSHQVYTTSLNAAEMVKYVCNAFHALKVAFANEVGTLCRQLDVDERDVMKMFISDNKLNISAAYLMPGFAFGGSCLPKDLRALTYRAKQLDLDLPLMRAVLPSNQAHLDRAVEAVLATRSKKIGVLGLSFKPGTDDLRDSPSVQLIKRLLAEGRQVQIWDKDVSLGRVVGSNRRFIEEELPHIGALLSTDLEQVINSAGVVVVGAKTPEVSALLAIPKPGRSIIDLHSILPRSLDGTSFYPHEASPISEYAGKPGHSSFEAVASH